LLPTKSLAKTSILLTCVVILIASLSCEERRKSNPAQKKGEISSTQEMKESPQEGFLAPDFSLQDLGGKSITLSDFRGKVVLLNFWATWCGPCRREIPSLERLYHLRKDKGFEIVAVSVDRTSPSKVVSFVANYRMSFPVLVNPRGDVGQRYWTRSIPTSFLLDRRGVIRWTVIGAREWDDVKTLGRIDQLLSE
jgi:peroxiredoxin